MTDFQSLDDLRIIKLQPKLDTPLSTAPIDKTDEPAYRQNNLSDSKEDKKVRSISTEPTTQAVLPFVGNIDDSGEAAALEHNMLIISDSDLSADLKLTGFNKIIQWKPELFLNRKLSDIIARTPFIWMNLRKPGCREYIMRNVSGSSYNLLIAYSGSRRDSWVTQLSEANPDAVLIKTTKLKQFDSLSSEEILEQLMAKMIDVSRPDSKARKVLKFLFGCFLKK